MKQITLTILSIFSIFWATAQKDIREQVYVHLNSNTLLTGETLYISGYCQSEATLLSSPLSKILYVELIGEKGAVFQQKIPLIKGKAVGDYFIPSVVKTGTYQLIAYTQWMKNFGNYFTTPITIINPYEDYQISEEEQPIAVSFFPNQNQLVAGVKNQLGMIIKNGGSQLFKIKIVDDQGNSAVSNSLKGEQLHFVDFTPKSNLSYQLILEDESGAFSFFKLPKIKNSGSVLSVKELSRHVEIELQSTTSGAFMLKVFGTQNLVKTSPIYADRRLTLAKEDFNNGYYSFEIWNKDERIVSQSLFIGHTDIEEKASTESFGTRATASLDVALPAGNYSVSVRKKDEILQNDIVHSSAAAFTSYFGSIPLLNTYGNSLIEKSLISEAFDQKATSIHILPEFSNELISGKLTNIAHQPIPNTMVSLTLTDTIFQTQFGVTDNEGNFSIQIVNPYADRDYYLTAISESSDVIFEMEDKFLANYPDFSYSKPSLDSTQIHKIIERSIRNQIENAYYAHKRDEIIPSSQWQEQIVYDQSYALDDYERFETIAETFTEFIVNTSARAKRDPIFKIYMKYPNKDFENPSLILLDGLPVSDTIMFNYDPYNIKKISMVTNRYYWGPMVADGLISFQTFEGNLTGLRNKSSLPKTRIKGFSPAKNYFVAQANPTISERTPDQREQLLWLPDLKIEEAGSQSINFSTSDLTGNFELIIEGFSSEGAAVTLLTSFSVEDLEQ